MNQHKTDLFSSQKIIHGDCLEKMRNVESNSIDCILTDPPYGLNFMGKHWDKGIPGVEFWKEALRISKPGAHLLAFGGTRTYHRLVCAIEDAGWEIRDCLMWIYGSGFPKGKTCLKPAWEPIILSRKKGNVRHLNIDECRIGTHEYSQDQWSKKGLSRVTGNDYGIHKPSDTELPKGRWPANILFDEEAAAMLDEHTGNRPSSSGIRERKAKNINTLSGPQTEGNFESYGDFGGASRFFYCAKASSAERGEFNRHPTVKPVKLLEYLLKLIMPPSQNAVVLDPFMGSGSTLVAAKNLGFNAIGIEIEKDYCEIASKRLS